MGQNAETGRAANDYGYRCARAVAKHLGARVLGKTSNEVVLHDDDHAVIKSARHRTSRIGVPLHMLGQVRWVVAALEDKPTGIAALDAGGNSHSLYRMSTVWYRARMTPSRSKSSPSAKKVMMVATRDIRRMIESFDIMPAGWDS